MIDAKRPQDLSRSPGRRAKGKPSAASARLVAAYQQSMRYELRDILAEIKAVERPASLKEPRPSLAQREKLWRLAIVLGRELGSEIDVPAPSEDRADSGAPAAIRAVDFG